MRRRGRGLAIWYSEMQFIGVAGAPTIYAGRGSGWSNDARLY